MKRQMQLIQLVYKNYIKLFFIIILFLTSSNNIIAQWNNFISFDTPANNIYIDTLQTNNIWQIGAPHKILFDTAWSRPNAIVTDTVNYYPVNDTSSFVIKIIRPFLWQWIPDSYGPTPFVSFISKINTDSLLDGGYVEYSINNGNDWLLVNGYFFGNGNHPPYFGEGRALFTGTWNTWIQTSIVLGDSNPDFGIETVDSVLFKFTFVSDGINTNKEGWIIDEIEYGTVSVIGINNIREENYNFNIYPNPVENKFCITFIETGSINNELKIYNVFGDLVYQSLIQNSKSEINISDLPNGMYFVKLISDKQILTKKIIKE